MCRLIVGGPLSLSPVACVALLLAYSRNGRYLPAVPNLSGFCSWLFLSNSNNGASSSKSKSKLLLALKKTGRWKGLYHGRCKMADARKWARCR